MSRPSDPKTLADAYTALHQGTLTVEQRGATRTIARILKAAGAPIPTVKAAAAGTKTVKASATPRKTNDPQAPYGRKADGTPRAKPGRKAAAPVMVEVPAEKPKRVRKPKITPAPEIEATKVKRQRTRKTSETGVQVVA
jgi:hypothetical protein